MPLRTRKELFDMGVHFYRNIVAVMAAAGRRAAARNTARLAIKRPFDRMVLCISEGILSDRVWATKGAVAHEDVALFDFALKKIAAVHIVVAISWIAGQIEACAIVPRIQL